MLNLVGESNDTVDAETHGLEVENAARYLDVSFQKLFFEYFGIFDWKRIKWLRVTY